ISQRQHSGLAQLALDREIEVFAVRQPVMNVVAGEKVKRLVNRKIEGLIRWRTRNWRGERKALSQWSAACSNPEWFVKHNRDGRSPIQPKWRVRHFIEKIQVLDRRVINAVGSTNTGLPGTSKNLA